MPEVERETTIGSEAGLHARPAARFVKSVEAFSSEIPIRVEGDDTEETVAAPVDLISQEEL